MRAIPVDGELRDWIRRRLARVDARELLRAGGRAALFPNPTARNGGWRWVGNAMRGALRPAAEPRARRGAADPRRLRSGRRRGVERARTSPPRCFQTLRS